MQIRQHLCVSYLALLLQLLYGLSFTPAYAQSPVTNEPENFDGQYQLSPDSSARPGVPIGSLRPLALPESRIYSGFTHNAWLYLPANYDKKSVLSLMIFLDGSSFIQLEGAWRAPTVLDNLIAERAIPQMAAVFLNPGATLHDEGLAREQRSLEYDTLSSRYAEFLIDEVLPEVRKFATITDDPEGRGLAGFSSGGVCAFTVAWQKPDSFRKVFSAIGSFVDIRGAGAYPEEIRQSVKKPIRIFIQDGSHDHLGGAFAGLDWPAGTRAMARAAALKGYDFQLVMGAGTHSPRHGASIFPAAMRWLWRDYRGH